MISHQTSKPVPAEQLKKMQYAEMKILQEFIRVCKLLKLDYFAVYGTALGAVRHQGFIPWDDDIDVGMLRCDFSRFVAEAPALLSNGFYLQWHNADFNYGLFHAKLMDNNTTFFEKGRCADEGCHGLFIDIFPFDFVPEKTFDKIVFKFKKKIYQNVFCILGNTNYWRLSGVKYKTYAILQPLAKKLLPKRSSVAKKLIKLYESLEKSSKVSNMESSHHVFPYSMFQATIRTEFEDMYIQIPTDYHNFLSIVYGNYMQLPPEENRYPSHVGGLIDVDKPYTYYLRKR